MQKSSGGGITPGFVALWNRRGQAASEIAQQALSAQIRNLDDESEDSRDSEHLAWGGKIKAVQEDSAEFTLQFEDGSTVILQLADPGSSVAGHDKNNQVEYLG